MSKVIDSIGNIKYEGSNGSCERVLYLSDCDPSEVTEEDELMYGDFLACYWKGDLTIIQDAI